MQHRLTIHESPITRNEPRTTNHVPRATNSQLATADLGSRLPPLIILHVAHGPSMVLRYYMNTDATMPMSIRLDPALEAKIDLEARRLGLTKSEFVKDALQRVLGLKSPARLLRAVRRAPPMGDPGASQNVSARVKAKLRAKRAA